MEWNKLFSNPYKEKILRILPTLFNMVELENRRGKKLGMEVGTARERVLIALLMYVYGNDQVIFPPSTSHEMDVRVCGRSLSIKTKSNPGYGNVKLVWTVDWNRVDTFVKNYMPSSDLLYVNIIWDNDGGFFLIPQEVQQEALKQLGRDSFFKLPKRNTNPRGVELSSSSMKYMQEHSDTLSLNIHWQRDKTLLKERALYHRWIELWDSL